MGNAAGKLCSSGASKSLSKEDMDYLLAKTKFTRKQIQVWYKSFMKDCPDSVLTRKTFLEMYTQFFPDDNARGFYEHLFRTFDSDKSGNIDFKEFLCAIHITQNGTPQEKLELAFKLYDIDSNGRIERSEMIEIIRAIYKMVGNTEAAAALDKTIENAADGAGANGDAAAERTHAIFDRMDTNKDSVLSKEEFVQGCMQDESLFKMLACSTGAPEP